MDLDLESQRGWGDVVDWLDSKKCTGTKDGNNKTNQDIREVEK